MKEIYIKDTKNFSFVEYAKINAYFNRLFCHENDEDGLYSDQIKNLNLDEMNNESKTILYCIVSYFSNNNIKNIIKKYNNLSELLNVKPLQKPLFISERPFRIFEEYEKMNVIM
ncbi:MAG: hypothetical protein PUA62_07725 [Lachnospiraceae bacterium]|nr:hypothetical protein [Lachnospiraceae bacterium]